MDKISTQGILINLVTKILSFRTPLYKNNDTAIFAFLYNEVQDLLLSTLGDSILLALYKTKFVEQTHIQSFINGFRLKIKNDDKKENYMKYGTIYGKKYCVKTDYGAWDSEFTMDVLEKFIGEYYKKLKNGGTLILFFDLWKISLLKEIMEKYKFKQIRFIEWIKTNPQPLNSSVNYLTNCREIALLGIKGTKPTFNSKYDNGIYMFPLQGGKNRFHPTQKSLGLFEELITKHSNENDVVLDTFLGGGTTAIACKNTKRKFKGCEISTEYFDKVMQLI